MGDVDFDRPMDVYLSMGFSPDGGTLYHTWAVTDPDDPNNGVWEVVLDDFAFQHFAERTDP